jgi:hypothetical protein
MNANELADKLSDKTMRDYIVFEYLPEIVSMLRKQQESIEGLNRDYDLLFAEHQLLLKKEWASLTDEEILAVNMSTVTKLIDEPIVCDTDHNIIQLGKAIEAKLKDKNT